MYKRQVVGTKLVRAAGTVEALREIKDAGELALLRLACEAADTALADLIERGGLRPGRTERAVARELEALMLDHGADAISFETIVAAGPNSAIDVYKRQAGNAGHPGSGPPGVGADDTQGSTRGFAGVRQINHR